MGEPTIIELLDSIYERLTEKQGIHVQADREFAIAKTHIEDIIMRVNRGFAFLGGVEQTADVELELIEEELEALDATDEGREPS
jgi:hypothetical protein